MYENIQIRDPDYSNYDFDVPRWPLLEKLGDNWIVRLLFIGFYTLLYIENKTEEQAAKLMGYKTSEKDRKPGYKQIKNIQKSILEKAKKLLNSNSFDISDYGTF